MASALIGALRVTLGLDSAAFEKGAAKADRTSKKLGKSMGGLGKSMAGVGKVAVGLGAVMAGAFSGQAIKGALDYAAAIGEVATAVGVTQRELQVYRLLATQVNLTQEEMEKSLAKLTLSIGKAGAGAAAESRAFSALGISLKDAQGQGKSTGTVLLELADRIAAIQDPTQRSAAVFSIFGRQGQKMIPLLEMGSARLKEYAEEADKAGAIISDGDIAKADKTADKIDGLNKVLSVKFSSTVAANAESIGSMATALADLVTSISKFWAQNPKAVVSLLGALAGLSLGSKFGPKGALIGGAAGAIAGYLLGPDPQRTSAMIKKEIAAIEKGAARVTGLVSAGVTDISPVDRGARKPARLSAAAAARIKALRAELAEVEKLEKETLRRPKPKGETFEDGPLGNLFGSDSVNKAKKASTDIRQSLADMRGDIEDAFSLETLPESTEAANGLRDRLDDIAEKAREAGVPMAQFSGEVATLKARIAELETEGLAREADAFSNAVAKQAKEVQAFDRGALLPLEERIQSVDERYDSLREDIEQQIRENKALAAANAGAAAAMKILEQQLIALEAAHRRATDAAIAQHAAEQRLADIQAAQERARISGDIAALEQARGDNGPQTARQAEAARLERELNVDRLDALQRLSQFEAAHDAAVRAGDEAEAARLTGIIELQRQYLDLVTETSARQIMGAQRIQDAFEDFTSGLSDALTDMVSNLDFSFKSLKNVFRQLISDIFIRPAMDALSESIGNLFKSFFRSIFAGGFASGGVIPKGEWGIVGERGPEPIFAGDRNLRVFPNSSFGGGGNTTNIYQTITTPNPNDFRASQRQIANQAKRALAR